MTEFVFPKTGIAGLYGAEHAAQAQARLLRMSEEHARAFGPSAGVRWFSAPGRTEIGGNHTDHQQGCVLAAAVTLDAVAAAAPSHDLTVRVLSAKYSPVTVDLGDLTPHAEEHGHSAALIRGLADYFVRHGYRIGGFTAFTENDVPGGSGLSSSAAFEVLIASVMNGLFNDGEISPVELAKAGQYAENVHFGKPCGLMDQMASAVGGVARIDFGDPAAPKIGQLPVDLTQYGYALCIVDTGAYHDDLNGEYAAIPAEMVQVAEFFGRKKLREVPAAEFYGAVSALYGKVPDRAILRAMHFYADNDRAKTEADALERGDFPAFLRLVNESGRSSWMLLQNICPSGAAAQPAAVALACCEHLLAGEGACRIHGGGFAGTIQAFVPLHRLDTFRSGIESVTGQATCRILAFRNVGCTEILL